MSLLNIVHKYTHKKQTYSLLLIRNREAILNTIIPLLDDSIDGFNRLKFQAWKQQTLENSSTWNYRVIKSTGNPQNYKIVDNNPNTLTKSSG